MNYHVLNLINELKKYIGDFLGREKLIIIGGHPGSGKTTLASSICLASVQQEYRCLYISLQEPKEKFYEEIKAVGLNLEEYEKNGYFKFIKLPLLSDEETLEQLFNTITKEIAEFKPRVIVVDSITPLLKTVTQDVKARSYLQNYFYELQRIISGPVILIAELPYGEEQLKLGDVEFVSDVIIVLKHRVIRGLIARFMEIRKIRGHNLTLAEIPFSIQPQRGIVLLPPPILSEISEVREFIEVPCTNLSESIPKLMKSANIYYEYPPHFRVGEPGVLIPMLGLASNELRKPVLFITYKYPEDSIKALFERIIEMYAGSSEVLSTILNNIVVKPINPYAYSLPELNAMENELIERYDPVQVVFHDVGVLMASTRDIENYMHLLQNQIFYLKRKGIMVARYASRIDPRISRINASISDVIVKAICEKE
ncbi:MAG: ATPase domain-containing protein, partial [Desulfurococcaceae archaeon]